MVEYKKLNNAEKHSRYNNMKARCSSIYQDKNPKYKGTYMCVEWLKHKKETFFNWLDENYYQVAGEQMDIDKDILEYGNKQYHPDLCLIVPHSINSFYENLEVGKTNIIYNATTNNYSVNIFDMGKNHVFRGIENYNEALEKYCKVKQNILFNKAQTLMEYIPEKVYQAMMNTSIKAINAKHYRDESYTGDK